MKSGVARIFLLSLFFAAVCFWMPVFAGWEEQWRYQNEDGSWKQDEWIVDEDGSAFYIDPNGLMVRGWYEFEDGSRRFFDDSGKMARGLSLIDGRYYYFGEDGALEQAEATVDGQTLEIPKEGVLSGSESGTPFFWRWFSVFLMAAAGGLVCFLCRKRRDLPEIMVVTVSVVLASTPLLADYVVDYGHDITFQLNRVLGVKESLEAGMFPVRLNGYAFWGYGYADPIFYPQLFLYIPAVLMIAGMPFLPAIHCFMLFVNAMAAAAMYYSGKLMFRSSKIACCSAVLYVLSVYRLSNLYTRAAYGEITAMIFFPLVVCGLYELFYGEEKRWYLLVLAFTGIFQSHLISTVMTAAVCVAVGICSVKRLLEKKRLIAFGKVMAFSLLVNLWFLVPLLDYMGTEITTGNLQRVFWDRLTPWTVLLKLFPTPGGWSPLLGWDMRDIMALTPGLGVLCGMMAFLLLWIGKKERPERLARVLFCSGVFLMIGTSTLFPWRLLLKLPLVGSAVPYMQFPWRLMAPAVCALSLSGGYGFCRIGQSIRAGRLGHRTWLFLYAGVLALSMVSAQYYLSRVNDISARIWDADGVPIEINDFVQEYRYPGTDKNYLTLGTAEPSDERVRVLDSGNTVLSAYCVYETDGSSMENVYLDMPVLYYPGYRAVDEDGVELPVTRGQSNVVRVYPRDQSGTIRVYFKERRLWRLTELVSFIALAGFGAAAVRDRRKLLRSEHAREGV